MTSMTHELAANGRSPRRRSRWPVSRHVLAILAPLFVAVPFAAWGTGIATAAVRTAPRASTVWYVAPKGISSAPCGSTRAAACALISTAIGEATAGDTIRVAAGTYTAKSASGLVVITKNLTLTGAGRRSTVLDGKKLGTVITVEAGVTATVAGLAITGGDGTAITYSGAPVQAGGGVLNEGTLTLSHDALTGNQVSATASGASQQALSEGAGAFNADGGTLLIRHCLISGNSAEATATDSAIAEAIGGGVASFADLESPTSETSVQQSVISGNSVKATSNSAADAETIGSATAAGGGIGTIHSSDLPPVLGDSISGNKATSLGTGSSISNAIGAGVFEADSDTANAIVSSRVSGNTANAVSTGTSQAEVLAAGIAIAASNNGHALLASVVRGNTAVSKATGGGEAETISSGAGALASLTADTVKYSAINGNTAKAYSTGAGDAVVGGAALGGAVASMANAISDSVIDDNLSVARNTGTGSASAEGAIVAVESPVTGSQISGNRADATATGTNPAGPVEAAAAGGGIVAALNEISGSSASPVSTSSLARNVVSATYAGEGAGVAQAAGGAIGASTGVSDSAILGNRATATGSGTGTLVSDISLSASAAGLIPSDRSDLVVPAGHLGLAGLTTRLKSTVKATVTRAFPAPAPATAPRTPAKARTRKDDATMLASAIAGAGGIDGLTGPVTNTTVSDNRASATSTGSGVAFTEGAGISLADQLTGVTVAGNVATANGPAGSSVAGGGVGTSTSLANTIIAGNSPSDCGAPTATDAGGNLDSDGTCGLSAVNGSVSAGKAGLRRPRLNGGPTKTQALMAGSQAIGLGLAATCEQLTGPAGVADTDQRGHARDSQARGACDSGAYDTGGTP